MSQLLKSPKSSWLTSPTTRALGALVIVFVIGLIFNADGAFLKWGTHRDMLRAVSVYGLLACGMTLVIITGGIDLSVGSILGISAVSFSLFCIHFSWPFYIAIIVCLLIGLACGAASGLIISRFNIQPFIATLAMMVFARGLAKWISGGQKISTAVQQADGTYEYVPEPAVFNFINSKILWDNISVVTVIFLVCLLITAILLAKLRLGRYLYAIGGNEEAARLSGVPVNAIKVLAYAMSGLFCAVAGICQASQELQGDPEAGFTYELSAIAMVVIGGTTLRGGRGGIGLTLLGVLIIGYLEKILSINAVGEDKRLMLTGAIIVGAVLLQKTKK
ncbi:MAG: ABC transporter permease [Planctomycetes bacterium]|nr:ABC transporter permease [Planctomycetota bacterium]